MPGDSSSSGLRYATMAYALPGGVGVYFSFASGFAKAVVNSNMMGESGFEDRLKGLSLASRSMSWASRDDVYGVGLRTRRVSPPGVSHTGAADDVSERRVTK